jgi:hypothetical protein
MTSPADIPTGVTVSPSDIPAIKGGEICIDSPGPRTVFITICPVEYGAPFLLTAIVRYPLLDPSL